MSFPDEDLIALEQRLKKSRYSVGSQTVVDVVKRMNAAEGYIIALETGRNIPGAKARWLIESGKA